MALPACALALGACGGDGGGDGASVADLRSDVREATRSRSADFPPTAGRTLQEIADTILAGPQVGLATSVFTPGRNRLAFGMIDPASGDFLYGPTAVYLADSPQGRARGPFPAPADLLLTDPAYRSRTAAAEDDPFAAVYSSEVPLPRPGPQAVLVATHLDGRLVGGASAIEVVPEARDRTPDVGDRAPVVDTDTVESAGGDIAAIDTRVPHDDMHSTSLRDVIGAKPVALLFSTPALCMTRVCGPVTDIALELKQRYGDRVEFIHQEVYEDNDPAKGVRAPMRAFGLQTEPWLFTIDAGGRIAARLEGSFGFDAFEAAIEAALDERR